MENQHPSKENQSTRLKKSIEELDAIQSILNEEHTALKKANTVAQQSQRVVGYVILFAIWGFILMVVLKGC